ncbi:MAG TPA: hypothetical protein VFR32_02665 [Gaiellaceae bacterium]|nr:hypothetical protein [Gaiellaceae bacterium]
MRQVVASTFGLALMGAAVAVVAVLGGVDRTDLVLDAYLVYAGGLLALAAARIASRAFPAPRRTVPGVLARRTQRYVQPESLTVMEDDVALAQADEFDLHYRLRPALADIASAGLAARDGIELAVSPERAEARLTPATWELVRPGRPRPERGGAGIDTASLRAVVGELETILPP